MRHAPVPVLAALALIAGCATDGAAPPVRPTVKAGEFGTAACFHPRTVFDFDVLDYRNLVVFAPSKADAYHVQVSPPSTELRSAEALSFSTRNARICGYAGDSLTVSSAHARAERLSVMGVYRLDERALDGLLARFGQGSDKGLTKGIGEPPVPGAGAEVEPELESGGKQ